MGLIARLVSIRGLTRGLRENDLTADPLDLFDRWYGLARRAFIYWPNSTALATVDDEGRPAVRMVLLKGHDDGGFVFYTNYDSPKGRHLENNPSAALVIYWNDLMRQVRISGKVRRVSRETSEAYFHSRPRGSQLGAWASNQSGVIASRDELIARTREVEERFRGKPVDLPPFWGGYSLEPDEIEFWQGRTYRLHDRFLYTRDGKGWTWKRLSP